jgi:hypothetical protein
MGSVGSGTTYAAGTADVQRSRWRTDCFYDDLGAGGLVGLRGPLSPQVWGRGCGEEGVGLDRLDRVARAARSARMGRGGGWCIGGSGFWYTSGLSQKKQDK